MRIISGKWRGRKLPVLDAQGLRPTTDRTKETLFNWLMNDIRDARCLDAFAGSGSLGFEALSRGASDVVFFEKDKRTAENLKKNSQTLNANAQIICGDSLSLVKTQNTPFDIVFVDPPFGVGLLNPFLNALQQQNLLKPDGLLYVEHEAGLEITLGKDFSLHREKTTPQFRYALYSFNGN